MSTYFFILNDPETIGTNMVKVDAETMTEAECKFVRHYFKLFDKMGFTYSDVITLLRDSGISVDICPEHKMLDTLVESYKS
jgi:hypothetical protein